MQSDLQPPWSYNPGCEYILMSREQTIGHGAAMPGLLRVLFVEDTDDDAQLLLRELRRNGYEVEYQRVETRPAMEQALRQKTWDVILCDYSLPQFDAMAALSTLKESGLDIPFFVISGSIQEEAAVTALKAGAHDFMVKGRFARLVPAIERELQDVETRRLRREGEEERASLSASLEALSAELERFLYTAFHDLRSPLVTIKGFLGLLGEDIKANRTHQIQKDIERIGRAADQMEALLAGLLELSRIGRVIHPPEEVDLGQLTREALEELDEELRARKIEVKVVARLPTVYGDRRRLREVLENLIDNAVKHMRGQDRPVIEIGVRKQEDAPVIFVRDNGPGIEPRYHNRIFNLFEKLDPSMEGPGIGLALVKRIVELHGGRVWVESEGEQQGATFCFTIPDGSK
jgi:signal transduction histidine kinase